MVFGHPLLEDERTGADRVAGKFGQAHLLNGSRRDDAQIAIQVGQQRRVGLLHHQLDGAVVDDLGVVVRTQLVVRLAGLDGGIDHPIHGEFDGFGIERRAVVELDALFEFEGVLLGVRRDVPRVGQTGYELAGFRLPDQRLAHVERYADGRIEVGDLRIERIVYVETEPVGQAAAGARGRGRNGWCDGRCRGRGGRGSWFGRRGGYGGRRCRRGGRRGWRRGGFGRCGRAGRGGRRRRGARGQSNCASGGCHDAEHITATHNHVQVPLLFTG